MAGDDRINVDAALARRLIATQFPHRAGSSIEPVRWDGWGNRTFHLGDTMKVRLPSAVRCVPAVEKEPRRGAGAPRDRRRAEGAPPRAPLIPA